MAPTCCIINLPCLLGQIQVVAGLFLVSFSHVKRIHNFEAITFVVGGPIKSLMVEVNRGGSTRADL